MNIKKTVFFFNSLVKPVLLYGSEVWGDLVVNLENLGNIEKGSSKICFSNVIESAMDKIYLRGK